MRVSYRNTTPKGSTKDPRFTIVGDDLPTYGDGDKARPCVEIPTDAGICRIVMPRNVYIPGGAAVGTVSFEIANPTVEAAPVAADGESDAKVAALEAQLAQMQQMMAAFVAAQNG